MLSNHTPALVGYTYWLLKDYRSRKTDTGKRRSDGWSKMGLYSTENEPKLVRDTFKELEISGGAR